MTFEFQSLPYAYDALEPYVDAQTMEIHHSRHHKTYFDKFTDAVKGSTKENQTLEEIFAGLTASEGAVRNNGGGFYNHNLFWNCMAPNGEGEPTGALKSAIDAEFTNYETLKAKMNDAGVGRFGSGFVWLIVNGSKKLEVVSTPNQDNPLMSFSEAKGSPIFCIDVWEHAYYLKYQNKRPEYLNNFWKVASWSNAEKLFSQLS